MLNKVSSVLERLVNPDKSTFNILTMPTHEGYQTMLGETSHQFYMLNVPNQKTWDFHTRSLPKNHYLYNLPIDQIHSDIHFDIVLCQNRVAQWDILSSIAHKFGLPLIVLDHTEPPPNCGPQDFQILKSRIGDHNVFITQHNQRSWMNLSGSVIPHGINTDIFQGYQGNHACGISMVNYFQQRDIFCGWTLWNEIKQEVAVDLIGENPGLSQSINNVQGLVNKLMTYRYYLNTSQHSPVPLSVLEAMSVGLPIITTSYQELPNIITNGENGFISNDKNELINYCKVLENDPTLAYNMGQKARQTIIDRFSIQTFSDNWTNIFKEVYGR